MTTPYQNDVLNRAADAEYEAGQIHVEAAKLDLERAQLALSRARAMPDLLAAVVALTDPEGHIWHGSDGACTGECRAVRAAIAKAEGKP